MPMTVDDFVTQMRDALAVSEPDLDTTVGSLPRKILDAVAEVAAEAYVDRYLLEYQYDVDVRSGADLDDFVSVFGMTRLAAKRATGLIEFERTVAAETNILIPLGSQFLTDDAVPVVVATTVPAVLISGQTVIEVPAQALVGGAAGNVGAFSITRAITTIGGITSFTNPLAFTGGADAESDEQLRQRFKNTVLRNLAGTEQNFLAIGLDVDEVTQANVIGVSERFREQIQVVGGVATSTNDDAKHIYPGTSVFGPSLDTGDILAPDVHYFFDATVNPPTIGIIDATAAPDGIYELEYEYVANASRNDPSQGVTNRIDIYVSGERLTEVSETAVFRTARVFNTTLNDPLNRANFERVDGSQPVAGNYFIDYAFGPVIDPSATNQIVINAVTYIEGTDYWLVNEITENGGTPNSPSGIEFLSAANGQAKAIPANNTNFQVQYLYNAVPGVVEEAARAWRLITTDVRVHQAKLIRLNIHLAVIYAPGFDAATVNPVIEQALAEMLGSIGFDNVVQVSDLLQTVHDVAGVDAVRLITSTDDSVFTGNLLTANQASLETDTTGWAGDNANTTITRSTAQASDGSASLAMTSVAAGDIGARTLSGTSGIPVTPRELYKVRVEIRPGGSIRTCRLHINWYTAAGAFISNNFVDVAEVAGVWTPVSLIAEAPATAAFASIAPWALATGGAGEVHYVDDNTFQGGKFALQRMAADGTTVLETYHTGGRARDILIGNDEVPQFNDLIAVPKAQNTFGVV